MIRIYSRSARADAIQLLASCVSNLPINDYSMVMKFLLVAFLPSGIFGFGKTVYIGGLFEEDSLPGKAFRISIASLNGNRHGSGELPNQFIQAEPVVAVNNDSYDTSRIVCHLANEGVAAIFGPQDDASSRLVQSMCNTMEIPHVAARWDSRRKRGNGHINMHPHSETLSTVYLQLAISYNWKRFTILYENTESLIRMNQLLKRWDPDGHTVTIRQLPKGPCYRQILREVKGSGDLNIVLDCSIDILPELLKQAQQVGITSNRHNYIIGSLDLKTINLEPYQHGGTNFSGLRLVDPEDPRVVEAFDRDKLDWDLDNSSQLTVEAALIYDGVQLFGRALKQLDDAINADVGTLLCDNFDSWEHGPSLLNFMRLTEFRGLTGVIRFDGAGHRSDFKLDVMSLNVNGMEKVGVWNSSTGMEFIPNRESLGRRIDPRIHKQTFVVLISLTAPYGMLKESTKMEIGNDRYEGFGIDIIREMSQILGFNYTFKEHDLDYGSRDPVTKEWTGMIKEIMEDEAHLAITDLTITADRQEAVDFTTPIMNLGISILFTKPRPAGSKLFSFLLPFSFEVWMYTIGAYTVHSLLLFVVGRLCPAEWINPYPCIKEPRELKNQFTFRNAFWFNLGCIMRQGSGMAPIGLSTRILTTLWSFFCLIMCWTYTANMAAFLVIVSKEVLIKDVVDLANNHHGIKYGAKFGGTTIDFFKASTDPVFSKMYRYMMDNEDEVMLDSNEEGVEKVLEGNYAFLMESSTIAYETERRCELDQVGSLLDDKGYGIAMKKYSPYRHALNAAVLRLHETGAIKDLERKWWIHKRGGGNCRKKKSKPAAPPLGTDNVGGVFLVLIVGMAISCVYTAWELISEVGRTSIRENISFKNEIKEELKFVMKCNATTKPVRRRRNKLASNG